MSRAGQIRNGIKIISALGWFKVYQGIFGPAGRPFYKWNHAKREKRGLPPVWSQEALRYTLNHTDDYTKKEIEDCSRVLNEMETV